MITIHNLDKIIDVGSSINKWYISTAGEQGDMYGFAVSINGKLTNIFYLNRNSTYVSGRNEPVYRLYRDIDQTKINRWLSKHQISPYFIGKCIDDMLKE